MKSILVSLLVTAVATLAGGGCAPTEVSSAPSTAPVASVIVSPSADNLLVGDSQQLVVLLKDGKGRPGVDRDISWASLNPETAAVSPTGIVSGHAPGTAQIVATSEGKSGTAVITVLPTRKDTAECDAPRPGWIWCDDFEKDRLRSYFEYGSIDQDFVRLPNVGYGGSAGMRARFSRACQVSVGHLHLAIGKTPSAYFRPVDAGTERYREIYWRHLIKFQIGWVGAGGNKMSRAQVLVNRNWAQAATGPVWSGIMSEGEPYRLGLAPSSGTDEGGTVRTTEYNDFAHYRRLAVAWSRTPIFDRTHVGKWYCIEVHARLNDPGRSNGLFELWINGAPEARIDGLNWQGAYTEYGINTVFLENYWNDGAPQPQERYFDNFIVSTQRIGC
jgi:hypothetical protein